jgi:hypothetical protein
MLLMRPSVLEASSIYRMIYAEGVAEGQRRALHRVLRRQGECRFGAPRPEEEAALASIVDIGRLDRMIDRVLSATDWADLLATP